MISFRISVLIGFIFSLLVAGYLGFSSIQLSHDKILHFITFLILTIEFYFIFDTHLKSLKTLRYVTFIVCTLAGGIGSEVLQDLVNPNRVFDVYDIANNICGSLLGIAIVTGYQYWVIKRARSQRFRHRRASNLSEANENEEQESQEDGFVSIQMKDVTTNV